MFWNFAFAALIVVLVPVIRDIYAMDPGAFGISLSAFGLGSILGTWTMKRFSDHIRPNVILLFGPGSSVIAVLGMAMILTGSAPVFLYACTFVLGFGHSMWLVTQDSVRQLVTPSERLGRVNAVIQTAIYGIRPVGALAGGLLAGSLGPQAGIFFVVLGYTASFFAALFRGLRGVRSYRELSYEGERGQKAHTFATE
nr:MFS transporter [uncultured Tateyamaria sp.]